MTKSRDLGNLAQTVAVNLPTALGTAGQSLVVNSGADGLEFGDAAGGLDSAAVTGLVDSDYVIARAPAGGGGVQKDYRYTGILYVQNGTSRLYITSNSTLNEINAYIDVGPVGNDIGLRINKNGTSATTVTITDGTTSATTTPNVSFVSGDYITVDITSVGSTTAGSNLYMVLKFS